MQIKTKFSINCNFLYIVKKGVILINIFILLILLACSSPNVASVEPAPRSQHSQQSDDLSTLNGKIVSIASVFSSKCIDADNWGQSSDTLLHMYSCKGGTNQQFKLSQAGENQYRLSFVHSGKCLTASKLENGASLSQQNCDQSSNLQKFSLIRNGNVKNAYSLRLANNQCLDIADWNRDKGAKIQTWDCTGWANQRFFLYPVVEHSHEAPPLLISYQNNKKEIHTANLRKSLKYYKWDYQIVGKGQKWLGFGTKFIEYLRVLKTLDPNRVVVLSDSTDVLVNGDPTRFMDNYLRVSAYEGHNRIVSSTEMACCVLPMQYIAPGQMVSKTGGKLQSPIHDVSRRPDASITAQWTSAMAQEKIKQGYEGNNLHFDYLNSGMIVGRAKDLVQMFEFVKATGNEDDQALFTEYFLLFPDRVMLDYNNVLFSNAYAWSGFDSLEGCFFKLETSGENNRQFMNTKSKTYPTLIQTPAKYWTCYDHLLREAPFIYQQTYAKKSK